MLNTPHPENRLILGVKRAAGARFRLSRQSIGRFCGPSPPNFMFTSPAAARARRLGGPAGRARAVMLMRKFRGRYARACRGTCARRGAAGLPQESGRGAAATPPAETPRQLRLAARRRAPAAQQPADPLITAKQLRVRVPAAAPPPAARDASPSVGSCGALAPPGVLVCLQH